MDSECGNFVKSNLEEDSLFIVKPYQIDPMKNVCVMKVQLILHVPQNRFIKLLNIGIYEGI